ncbi:hypothetical protein N0V85_001607 [Neurospora sp. IMI 360204]|nr:hypothetical protein N0V85_001607 [Neurospora sp. IMI 360204]
MVNELVAMGPLDGHSSMRPTYTSVLSPNKYNDERHRYWFAACKIAETHFGVSQLPDPLQPHDGESVTLAQATAANRIHECYIEGFKDVMMRFYNLGLSRVSTAAHLYALDFSLWMRGYALGCSDFGDKFHYTKPSAHVGPFSTEYDIFYHGKQTERFRERQMANGIATPSDMPFPSAPGGPHHVTATSTNIGQPSREENERPNPEISATEAHPKSTAQPIHGSDKHSLDVTITNAGMNQPLREETQPAHPEVSATETHPASTAQPRRRNRGMKKRGHGATITGANIDQPLGEKTKPALLGISAAQTHATSTAQQSRGSIKRSLDTADTTALAPQPKRPQPGLPLRMLTPVPDCQEAHLPSQAKQKSQAPTVPPVPQSSAQAKTSPESDAKVCGNKACGRLGHELADCFGPPSNVGDIDGCPFCNTQEHVLDNCPLLGTATKDDLFNVLVTQRANLPLIRTAISFLDLAASHKKLDVLAETMPLQRRTARWTYSELKLWENPDPSKLFRDPEFSSDPKVLMIKLYETWDALVGSTTRIDRNAKSIPEGIMLFRRKWIHELVPYNTIYHGAKINVQGGGIYPFGPKDELLRVQKGHREMVQERLFAFLKEHYELQPSKSENEGVQDEEE